MLAVIGLTDRVDRGPYPVPSFQTVATGQLPPPRGFSLSICLHAAIISLLLWTGRQPGQLPQMAAERNEDSMRMQIRIGDKLYYVARLAPASPAKAEPRGPARRSLSSPPARVAEPKLEAAARTPPRLFTPPPATQVKPGRQTLIQPAYPADLPPPANVQVPELLVWTPAPPPKMPPKPFVSPGAKRAAPPVAGPEFLPEIQLRAQDLQSARPALTVPPPSAPMAATPYLEALPEMRASVSAPSDGDAVRVLSIPSSPLPPRPDVAVPPGNSIGPAGSGTVLIAAEKGNARGSSGAAPPGSVRGSGSVFIGVEGGTGSGKGAGPGTAGAKGTGSGAGAAGAGSGKGAGASGAGAPGSVGTGVRGAGSVIAAVPKLPRETATPLVARLTRPSTGKFDAVVIQSNVLDQFPESKTLLTGRPVYTVYLPMGTAKDWILHFCIPGGEGGAGKQNGPVVRLSAGAPVQAPYPTIMLRPVIVLLPGERYVLLHGFITSEGRFEKLRIVKPGTAQTNELLLSSLPSWEFRPATRDGQPMRVEFLLAIPPDQL